MNEVTQLLQDLQLKTKPDGYQGFCGHCQDQPCSCYAEYEKENALRLEALRLVSQERDRQITLWGNVYFKDLPMALCVLGEEVGELAQSINDTVYLENVRKKSRGGKENILKEATQVAAVATKLIQMLLSEKE